MTMNHVDEELASLQAPTTLEELVCCLNDQRQALDRALGRIAQLESHAALSNAERALEKSLQSLGPPYHTCTIRLLDGGHVIVRDLHDGRPALATTVAKLQAHIRNYQEKTA